MSPVDSDRRAMAGFLRLGSAEMCEMASTGYWQAIASRFYRASQVGPSVVRKAPLATSLLGLSSQRWISSSPFVGDSESPDVSDNEGFRRSQSTLDY